jgi:hypothetical protein
LEAHPSLAKRARLAASRELQPDDSIQGIEDTSQLINVWFEQAQQAEILIKQQLERTQALGRAMRAMINLNNLPAAQTKSALISAIQDESAEVQEYLRALNFKIFTSPLPAAEVLTPKELTFYQKYHPFKINTFLTGDPLSPPEWRPNQVDFPDASEELNPQEELHLEPGPPQPNLGPPVVYPNPAPVAPVNPPPSTLKKKTTAFARTVLYSSTRTTLKALGKVKEKFTSKKKRGVDGNNNSTRSEQTSTFYVDLDPEVFEVAF